MSTAYEQRGRTAQKQRTRAALVDATRALVTAGETPNVEAAADAAGISRATAYRYFPNQRALLAAAHPETISASLLPEHAPADAAARFDLVLERFLDLVLTSEAQQRTMLRLSLDAATEPSDLPLRQGRAVAWFTEALEPLRDRLGDDGVHRLVLGVRSTTGIEALVWLVDVGGLDRTAATDIMRTTAWALFRAAAD